MRLLAALVLSFSTILAAAQDDKPAQGATTSTSQEAAANDASQGRGPLDPSQPQGITVDQIVQRFSQKESEFRQAWDQYTFRQDVKIETLDGDTPTGEYREVTDITFTDAGKRIENVVFAPQPTLVAISVSREDLEDIRHRYPFVLSSDELPIYQILYVGKQKVDELQTYVFDIAPKKIEKDKRYVQGRIWVDQQDLQIVMTHLKPVYMESKATENQQFPAFTTYREQIDGQYWFPTYSRADEVLHFKGGKGYVQQDVHIRVIVKYQDYKRFAAKSRIIFNGEEVPEKQAPPKK